MRTGRKNCRIQKGKALSKSSEEKQEKTAETGEDKRIPQRRIKEKESKGDWKEMADIKYEIIEEIGVLSENAKGWRKELNVISWNGARAKYDLRDWAPEHEKMGKGITLTQEEAKMLVKLLSGRE